MGAHIHDNFSDQELIEQYLNGVIHAGELLINRYRENIYSAIFYLVHNKEVADDLFQDTFLKIFEQIRQGKYQEQGKFLPWGARIARNLCYDFFRQNKREVAVVFQDGTNLLELVASHQEPWDKTMQREETCQAVEHLIASLPLNQREVVLLRIYGELSFREIAELTDTSINTILGRMRYALINMRKTIEMKGLVLR